MGKYFDEVSAKQIGARIRKYRKEAGFSLEDVAAMTGFSVNTLSSIENGGDTYVSFCLAICRAIRIEPSRLFDISIELTPVFELPPDRQNRAYTTQRVGQLYESGFFSEPRLVVSVLEELEINYGIRPDSSEVSTALKKLTDNGKLEFTKLGRRNLYINHGVKSK